MAKKRVNKKPRNMPGPDKAFDKVCAAAWAVDVEPAPPPSTKRRREQEQPSKGPALTGAEARKRAKHGLKPGASLKELALINKKVKNAAKAGEGKQGKKAPLPTTDLWADEPLCPQLATDDWQGPTKMPGKYKQKVFKKTQPEKSAVPAVEVAAAGASIKPREEDRKRLVVLAASQELQKQEARDVAHAARRHHKMMNGEQPDLLTSGGVADLELEYFDYEQALENSKPVENKKLTRAQRNKRDRHKARLAEQSEAKKAKSQKGQLGQVDAYNKQLTAEHKQQAKEAKERAASAEEKIKFFPRRLSKHSFEESRPVVLLAEEMEAGLRSTPKEGSLLRDRYQSLQKRNVLEVGTKQRLGHGKHKLKVKTRTVINKNGTGLNDL